LKAVIYTCNDPLHNMVLEAMFEGCPFECEKRLVTDYKPSEIAVVFGTYKSKIPASHARGSIMAEQKRRGLDTIVLDSGYLRRGYGTADYYMVGLNGLNGRADFRNHGMPDDRFKKLLMRIKPWRADGDHILLCGQVPWDASVDHINIGKWLDEAVDQIRKVSDRQIIFRAHPKYPGAMVNRTTFSRDPLGADLKNCWAVVTFNSNTGVEAVIHGIPVFAFDEGAMALPVASRDWAKLEDPDLPDRTQWLNNLAYCQWMPEEMREGLPWNHLFR
jgi:hypothetical protein